MSQVMTKIHGMVDSAWLAVRPEAGGLRGMAEQRRL
jgi:hypothetical protein